MVGADGQRLKVPHMAGTRCSSGPMPCGTTSPMAPASISVQLLRPAGGCRLVAGSAEYGIPFTCAVGRDNIFAVQFHLEKSAATGCNCSRTLPNGGHDLPALTCAIPFYRVPLPFPC